MKKENSSNINPPSLSFFNQYDEQSFAEYLETYCSMVQKKEKENEVNFFMEEEQQNNPNKSNIFANNLSFPSINFFEFKETPHFGGIASLKQIEIKQQPSFEIIKQENDMIKCKIEHNDEECQKDCTTEKVKDFRNNLLRIEEVNYLNDSSRQRRLKQIINFADVMKEELENTFCYFMSNAIQS